MARKIVICPSFAETHLIKCHIPNLIDTINPDIIIYNEGLFPQGPENKGHVDTPEFRSKWMYRQTNAGFDFETLKELEREWTVKYNAMYPYKFFDFREIKYDSPDVNACFLKAISNVRNYGFDFREGDLIFPLEPDAFHLESDAGKINELVSQLKPGEGLQTKWVDFLETQYYTEAINLVQPKWRRFAYCFDNIENYLSAMSGFMSQNYSKLKRVDDFITYHYCWFRPEPYKQLRYDLIHRSNPQYWKDFEIGLQEIRNISERLKLNEYYASHEPWNFDLSLSHKEYGNIVIRSSRSDEGRFAQFIDVPHPKAIKNHPNYVK